MRAWVCAFALWSITTSPLLAKEEELRASPGGLAIGMLEHADAVDLFEVLPSEQIAVRHQRSGLICRFALEGDGRVIVFPGLPRGEDVGCDETSGNVSVTFYATRYPEPASVDALLAGGVQAIQARFPSATPYEPTGAPDTSLSTLPLPENRSARFHIFLQNGSPMFTRVSVVLINGWAFKMRFTMPGSDAESMQAADARADREWAALLEELRAIPNL
ncbi:MAG: hypothetical protein WDM79_07995 [Terricaulis sp.]